MNAVNAVNAPTPSPQPSPPAAPPVRSAVPRRPVQAEHTKWSPGLIGFYLSCAGVSLGAAIGFGAWKFFNSTGGLVFGCTLSAVSAVTCFLALRAARRPPPSAPQ